MNNKEKAGGKRASEIKGAVFGEPLEVHNDNIHDVLLYPFDLIDFYCVMDGFAFNGIEIFSFEEDKVVENFWTLQSISEYNYMFRNRALEIPNHIIAVGRSDEDIFIYDENDEEYRIVDRTDLMSYYEFSTFKELFFFVLFERGAPDIEDY